MTIFKDTFNSYRLLLQGAKQHNIIILFAFIYIFVPILTVWIGGVYIKLGYQAKNLKQALGSITLSWSIRYLWRWFIGILINILFYLPSMVMFYICLQLSNPKIMGAGMLLSYLIAILTTMLVVLPTFFTYLVEAAVKENCDYLNCLRLVKKNYVLCLSAYLSSIALFVLPIIIVIFIDNTLLEIIGVIGVFILYFPLFVLMPIFLYNNITKGEIKQQDTQSGTM